MLGNLGNGSNQGWRKEEQRPLDRMWNFSCATICVGILGQLAGATKMASSMLYDSKSPPVIYTSIFLHNGAHTKGTWARDVVSRRQRLLPLATTHAAARSIQYPFVLSGVISASRATCRLFGRVDTCIFQAYKMFLSVSIFTQRVTY